MQKKEATFNTTFNSWLRNVYKKTGAYELKQTAESSIPYSRLEQHQEDALLAVSNGTFVYKISDESIGFKPFDCFCYSNNPAFVVVLYQKSGIFYLITINNWVHYRDKIAKRKSLTEAEAIKICTVAVPLKRK